MNTSRMLLLAGALSVSLFAQSPWSANATTGVPNFQSTGVVKTQTVDTTIHGRGVRPRMTVEGNGTSYLYIPVTAPNTTKFGCLGLRAADNSNSGDIKAEFIQQPRNGNAAPAVTLGSVATANAAGDGFQFVTAPFAGVAIDYNLFSYYVRVTMNYQGSVVAVIPSPIVFDVSLTNSCTH
jgi:hypothetical protein